MFIVVETKNGAEATINTTFVTHVTQLESAYPEAGSCIHFVSDRALEAKPPVSQVHDMLENAALVTEPAAAGAFMLRQ